jgi:hypothetical protein
MEASVKSECGKDLFLDCSRLLTYEHRANLLIGSSTVEVPFEIGHGSGTNPPSVLILGGLFFKILLTVHMCVVLKGF